MQHRVLMKLAVVCSLFELSCQVWMAAHDLWTIPEMQECCLCVYACLCIEQQQAALQPGVHVQPYVWLNVIRRTSGWTLDGLHRYKLRLCGSAHMSVCVEHSQCQRHQATSAGEAFTAYRGVNYSLLNVTWTIWQQRLMEHRPPPYRPVQTPSLRRPTRPSVSNYKPNS